MRALYRGIMMPESMRLSRAPSKRMQLTIPTLFAFGRLDTRFNEPLVRRLCANPERLTQHVEVGCVENAGKLLPDDAPDTVANRTLEWIQRTD